MKKVLSRFSVFVLAAVMLFSMAACGSGTTTENATNASGDQTAATTAAGAQSSQAKLSMLDFFSDEDAKTTVAAKAYRDAVGNFKKAHPNMALDEQTVPHDSYENKIKTLAAANELPDITQELPSFMQAFFANGQITDLKPILDADASWSGTFPAGGLGDYTVGQNILGVPSQGCIANSVLFWNTRIFKEAGINQFPANSDEFMNAVKAIKAKGYIPLADGNVSKAPFASQVMPGILWAFVNAQWYEDLKADKAKFTDPEPLSAINYMNDLIKAGCFNTDINSIDGPPARQLYYDGKAAMYVEGSWAVSSFVAEATQALRDETDFAIFAPSASHPELGDQITGGQGWGVSLSSNLKDESLSVAVDFLKQLTSPDIQGELVEGGNLAATNNAKYDESKLNPFFVEFLEMYKSHKTVVGCPEVQLNATYMDASYTGYQELAAGTTTPEKLAQQLQDAFEQGQQ